MFNVRDLRFIYVISYHSGPNFWDRVTSCWGNCSSIRQSPININTRDTIYRPFGGLKFLDLCGRISAKIRNNGQYLCSLNSIFSKLLLTNACTAVCPLTILLLTFIKTWITFVQKTSCLQNLKTSGKCRTQFQLISNDRIYYNLARKEKNWKGLLPIYGYRSMRCVFFNSFLNKGQYVMRYLLFIVPR